MMIKKRNISPKFVNCPKAGDLCKIVNIKNLYNLQVYNIYIFKNMFFSRKNNLIIILVLVLFSIFILNLKKAPLKNKLIITRGMKYTEQLLNKKVVFKKVNALEFYNAYQLILSELYNIPKQQDVKSSIINTHLAISKLNIELRLQREIAESINPQANLSWSEIKKIANYNFDDSIIDQRYKKMSLSGALMELRTLNNFPYKTKMKIINEENWDPKIYNINFNRQYCNQKNVDFTLYPWYNNLALPYDNKSGDFANLNHMHHLIFIIEGDDLICYNYKNHYCQEVYLKLKKIEIRNLKQKLHIMDPKDRQKISPLIKYIEELEESRKPMILKNIFHMDGEIYQEIQNICFKYDIFYKNNIIIPEILEKRPIIPDYPQVRTLSYEDRNIINKISSLDNSRIKRIASLDYYKRNKINIVEELANWSLRHKQSGFCKFNLPFDAIQEDITNNL